MGLQNLFGALGLESTLQAILARLSNGTAKTNVFTTPNIERLLVGNAQEKFRDEFFTLDLTKWTVYAGVLGSVANAVEVPTLGTPMSNGVTVSLGGTTGGSRYASFDLGVGAGAEVILESVQTFTAPFKCGFGFSLSQRIAANEVYLEVVGVDDTGALETDSTFATTFLENELNAAGFQFTGTTATNAQSIVRSMGTSELVSGALTVGTTVATGTSPQFMPATIFEIAVDAEEATFVSRAVDSTGVSTSVQKRTQKTPDPAKKYKIRLRARNATAGVAAVPASATQARLHSVRVMDTTRLSMDMNRHHGRNDSSVGLPCYVLNPTSSTVSVGTIGGSSPNLYAETTTAVLAANATQTGTSRDAGSTAANQIFVADVTSPTAGVLKTQNSTDGTTWWDSEVFNVTAGVPATITRRITCRYNRAVFVNGAGAMATAMRMTTALHKI